MSVPAAPAPAPSSAPEGGYPAGLGVDPACDGEREGCAYRNPTLILPQIACGQRCLFGEADPGSPEWYGQLARLVRSSPSPVYLHGVRGGEAARRTFARREVALRDDFVGSVLDVPSGCTDPDEILSRNGRRDARIADKAGLRLTVERDEEAMKRLYALYLATCERIGIQPLSPDFVVAERDRAPDAFHILFAWKQDEVVGAKLVLVQDGGLRIVEGSSDRRFSEDQPDAFLTREAIRLGLAHGVRHIDFGITEAENDGLRTFKRKMGFQESPDVVSLTFDPQTRRELVAPPPRPAMKPGRVDVALLESCNFACGFCYREPWVPELSEDQVHRRIDEVALLHHSGIAFSGGEPTLRSDLPAFIAYAREQGIEDVQLHTNGWRAADPAYARSLADAGLGSAMVSLHSHRADVFADVTSTRAEYFSRTIAAIDNLRDAGIYVLLSHVINALNYRDLPQYMRFVARRLPGAELFVFFVYPSVKGTAHPHLYPRLGEVKPFWHEALQVVRDERIALTVDSLAGLPLCMMEGFEPYSRWYASLDQEEETVGEVDDHLVKAPEMRHAPQCEQCRWFDRCPGFWSEYLDLHGDEDLVPVRAE